jgi:hypothetical protein
MLAIVPERVLFAGGELKGVRVAAVSRIAVRPITEYSEQGPHCVFADVAEQRTRVNVVTPLGGDDINPPAIATSGVLEIRLARSPGADSRKEIRMLAVVTQVTYRATSVGADRTVEFEALSVDGRTDPVSVVELD